MFDDTVPESPPSASRQSHASKAGAKRKGGVKYDDDDDSNEYPSAKSRRK